ncbi:MAG: regulatory iron-sulfur-containing complex subunit RicT [Isosphaeraceae bacterium]
MTQTYVVRHGQMRMLGEFAGLPERIHARGERVVARTDRGTELGEILCPATELAARFLENPTRGEIVRLADDADLTVEARLAELAGEGLSVCRELIGKRRIRMELVDVEPIFGGERMVFYYLAEKRVDFRELVKDLARVFKTRIEMRQIGVRDEAKLLADYGDCGKPVCCNTHLTRMPPVTMKMAKLQKTTLDPSKISGRCGRLKCCLRYEFETYQSLERELPAVGDWVESTRGRGRVFAVELLARRLVLEMEDHRRIIIPSAEILASEKTSDRQIEVEDDEIGDKT